MDQITHWGEGFLVIVGVLAAVFAGLHKIYKTARWIEEVHAQVHTNGGSTMRDAIARIEAKVDGYGERLQRLEQAHEQRIASAA